MPRQQLPKERRWYALQTQTGLEEVAAKALRQRIESLKMQDKIFNVLVPKEKKIKIKNGKRVIEEEKIFPGYVLVEMIVDDESWYVARNTPNITGFLGAGTTPVPLNEEEVKEILSRAQEKEPEYKIDFSEGDLVRILEEPFKDFEGKVVEVDKEKGKVKVLIQIFGKETPVELDYFQLKKL
jgi:transcriptional antiterminator NusG